MSKEIFDETMGVWRTIGGRRVFIKFGQTLPEAMRASGKFPSPQSKLSKLPYRDVTDKWRAKAKPAEGNIENMDFSISGNGTIVTQTDGKLKTIAEDEREIGKWFKNNFWGNCKMQPGIDWPQGLRSADIRLFDNCPLVKEQTIEIKTVKKAHDVHGINKQVSNAHGQSVNVLVDITGMNFTQSEVWKQLVSTMYGKKWVQTIIVKENNDLMFVIERNT